MSKPKSPSKPSRHKRLKRPARLQAAQVWLPQYRGKSIVRDYRKHFGVDLLCAIQELQMLGIEISPNYIAAVKATMAAKERLKEQEKREEAAKL